eukprot:364594-Chlamydomonas_euryale.AAC.2
MLKERWGLKIFVCMILADGMRQSSSSPRATVKCVLPWLAIFTVKEEPACMYEQGACNFQSEGRARMHV